MTVSAPPRTKDFGLRCRRMVCLGENADRQMSSDMIKIKRGLDIPLAGAPSGEVDAAVTTRAAGLLGADYHGMKPTMAVQVGRYRQTGRRALYRQKVRRAFATPHQPVDAYPPLIAAQSALSSQWSSRLMATRPRLLTNILPRRRESCLPRPSKIS